MNMDRVPSSVVTSIQPQLWVDTGAAALAFYANAFGAEILHQVGDGDDIVAQLAIAGAAFWVATAGPDSERLVPRAIGGRATSRMLLVVEDPDAVFARALAAGGEAKSAVDDEHGWRVGRMIDPFGHEWEIGAPLGPWPPGRASHRRTDP